MDPVIHRTLVAGLLVATLAAQDGPPRRPDPVPPVNAVEATGDPDADHRDARGNPLPVMAAPEAPMPAIPGFKPLPPSTFEDQAPIGDLDVTVLTHERTIKEMRAKIDDGVKVAGEMKHDMVKMSETLSRAGSTLTMLWIIATGPWLCLLAIGGLWLWTRRNNQPRQIDGAASDDTRAYWQAAGTRRESKPGAKPSRTPSGVARALASENAEPDDFTIDAGSGLRQVPTIADPKRSTVVFANPNWGNETGKLSKKKA